MRTLWLVRIGTASTKGASSSTSRWARVWTRSGIWSIAWPSSWSWSSRPLSPCWSRTSGLILPLPWISSPTIHFRAPFRGTIYFVLDVMGRFSTVQKWNTLCHLQKINYLLISVVVVIFFTWFAVLPFLRRSPGVVFYSKKRH